MFSEKEVAKYLNSNKSQIKHQDELPLNNQGQRSPMNYSGERLLQGDFESISMPLTNLTSETLPPFAELSELALFDRQEVEYFSQSEISPISSTESIEEVWPSLDRSHYILPVRDEGQLSGDLLATTDSDLRATHKSLNPRLDPPRVSLPPTGLVDVFLLLCARSLRNFFSTLTNKNYNNIAPAMLKGKLLLNLDEAQILSGLSQKIIMNAIKNHELPFQLIEKTYLVKSKDLEQFVDNL